MKDESRNFMHDLRILRGDDGITSRVDGLLFGSLAELLFYLGFPHGSGYLAADFEGHKSWWPPHLQTWWWAKIWLSQCKSFNDTQSLGG